MFPEKKMVASRVKEILTTPVFIGKPKPVNHRYSLTLLPIEYSRLNCGLAGIISFKNHKSGNIDQNGLAAYDTPDKIIEEISSIFARMEKKDFNSVKGNDAVKNYLGGEKECERLKDLTDKLKKDSVFTSLGINDGLLKKASDISSRMHSFCKEESFVTENEIGILSPKDARKIADLLEQLKDANWTLEKEILRNLRSISDLNSSSKNISCIEFYRKINTVLNSINILEVRGRDSAGISVFVTFTKKDFEDFLNSIKKDSMDNILTYRKELKNLVNYKISVDSSSSKETKTIVFTYKFAAEIGSLGDNISYIRNQIKNDPILKKASESAYEDISIGAHTRWASVGEISPLNCHPVDNKTSDPDKNRSHIIHVSLNGDIDNYEILKKDFEEKVDKIPEKITTDTKIIPLQVSRYIHDGYDVEEAFRLALSNFKGSHAIMMQTDLAPGKIFLGQKGSGQAVFVGIGDDCYVIASEVYGFVERTQRYYKLEGEKYNGQMVVLDRNAENPVSGIKSVTYANDKIDIDESLIQVTPITTRDVDRQEFEHFFLKEIFESPRSVRRTLQGRWEFKNSLKEVSFDQSIFPEKIKKAFIEDKIKKIFFIGQGTAGVAANASSYLMKHYLNNPSIQISALKSSELSGFFIDASNQASMEDALVVAITQSGTTTDTNKSVDMAKKCGAKTMAIVNRRDSDITFKVDGVLYTSTGRDIEMSVASTKAFYSQVTAGALLGLYLADLKSSRDKKFISDEIDTLIHLPEMMENVLDKKDEIEKAALKTANKKTYWATVGSGPNKAAADEIRIKLSELCYRTISSDYVEDKKHIDLSSEPLIIVCAAGARESVLSDIIKDNAIFNAHKSTTVVIADENETRFDKASDAVIKIPEIKEHLSPILVTLAGHLWGYHAARAINRDSIFFFNHKKELEECIHSLKTDDKELFEIIGEKEFREKIASFYRNLRKLQQNANFLSLLSSDSMSELVLLSNYLYGRLNPSDFDIDFGVKGTPKNMIGMLFEKISYAANFLSRPVDAIKHQAKTVTVGTSRIDEKTSGILFDFIASQNISLERITPLNMIVIKNIQELVHSIKGYLIYKIEDLNLLGEPYEETKISISEKGGVLKNAVSRVDKDSSLKGTKRIIVREGNVFIGKGQKDGRSLIIIPVTSEDKENFQRIDSLVSLNIDFKNDAPLYVKIKALGGKYDRIKQNVQENNITWRDSLIDEIPVDDLFGLSYEKIVSKIVSLNNTAANGED